MTDLDKFTELYESVGIKFELILTHDGNTDIHVNPDDMWSSLYFEFDSKGRFVSVDYN